MKHDRTVKIFLVLALGVLGASLMLQPKADALMALCGGGGGGGTAVPTATPSPAFVAGTSCVSAGSTTTCGYPTGVQAGDVIVGSLGSPNNITGATISNGGANMMILQTTGQFIKWFHGVAPSSLVSTGISFAGIDSSTKICMGAWRNVSADWDWNGTASSWTFVTVGSGNSNSVTTSYAHSPLILLSQWNSGGAVSRTAAATGFTGEFTSASTTGVQGCDIEDHFPTAAGTTAGTHPTLSSATAGDTLMIGLASAGFN